MRAHGIISQQVCVVLQYSWCVCKDTMTLVWPEHGMLYDVYACDLFIFVERTGCLPGFAQNINVEMAVCLTRHSANVKYDASIRTP